MDVGTIAIYLIVGILNMILATEWAKNGLLEIGIQRPVNQRVMKAVFLGVMIVLVSSVAHRLVGFDPILDERIAVLVVGIPLLWIPFYRRFIMPPGLYDFNRAMTRTNHWALANYVPGERNSEEKAQNLRDFGAAQNAIKMFKRAIELQLQGGKVRFLDDIHELDDESYNEWTNSYDIPCPVCPTKLKLPPRKGENLSGICTWCGSTITVRIEGNTARLHVILAEPIQRVTDKNKYNAGIAYSEMAWLYRMMNMFDEAKEALKGGLDIAEGLLKEDPENLEYLGMKSMSIFRLAEVNHIQGDLEKAKAGYQESIAIDRKLQDEEGVQLVQKLLDKIGKDA